MELVARLLSWIGFSYLTLVTLSALYLFIRLNLDLVQTLIYFAIVAVVVGIPYAILGLINRLISGSYSWLPWR
ncbi:MAG: hypothetical protein ISP99_04545 [Pseudomonadales bacterium]|nr:hypothetical protein [Pseudomonadales bacterium]